MIDSASHRVFKIGELARLIAGQLIPKRQGSAVNLACACRNLEAPALSMLWETQESLYTLLETLPRDNWDWSGESVVCDLNLPLEERTLNDQGYFSSGSLGIRRRRLGAGSTATRLGCAKPVWMVG